MCVCMHAYMHLCVHAWECVCVYVYACAYLSMHTHACMCVCACIYTFVCVCRCVCVCVCACMPVYMHLCVHACGCVCVYVHVCMHIYACIHIHTHMHALVCARMHGCVRVCLCHLSDCLSVCMSSEHKEKTVTTGKESLFSRVSIVRNIVIIMLAVYLARIQWNLLFGSSIITLASKDPIEGKVWHEVPCSKDYEKEEFWGDCCLFHATIAWPIAMLFFNQITDIQFHVQLFFNDEFSTERG